MPLPGGAADKFGNRYELCWTIYQFVRMLRGELQSIRIEDPGVKKAEFVVTSTERQEFHQAKRSHPDGKWSLSSLSGGETKLTQSMFTELVGNDARFVFVSSSDAPELRELTERARQAQSCEEFEAQFLVAKQHRDAFKRIKEQWDRPDTSKAFDVLRRIEIQTSDEQNINEKTRWAICALFLQNTESVYAELRGIAENSIHKMLSRDELVAHLAGRGFQLRKLTNAATSMVLIDEVTKAYLGSGRGKLIRKALIPRMTTRTLLDKINASALGSDFVVVGKAGVGKTACMIELVETLAEQKIPILAFRLDHFKPVSTAWELGKQLGLEESPTLVLGSLAEGRNAVLIVDQLDAVSTISGRNTDFLEAIESLLAEARGLRERVKLHVVVVCRAFDWENDHRLRRMITDKHVKIEVAEFSPEDVKAILSSAGHDIRFFQARQLELLRLPQNLSLFLDAGFSSSTAPVFNTAKDLFDRYWDEKRRAVARRTSPLQDQWPDVVQALCHEIPNEYRTANAQARFEELERKFEEPHSAPHGIRAHFVGSPIEETIGEKMPDEQWLKAIAKYHSEERPNRWAEPDKGGAWELACMLEKLVRNEPERFARLSLLFPDGTNPAYIERVLAGLKDASLEMDIKLAVCRKAYNEAPDACGKSIADILGNIEENLPEDAVQILSWLATEHTDPEKELWDVKTSSGHYYYGGEIHGYGINTVRGRAADAIRDLIFTNAEYISRFREVLDALVQDKSLSVRSCVASTLIAVAQSDKSLAMELFLKLADVDERLLATRDADRFIYYGLREDFKTLRPLIERMLKSANANVNEAGARLVSLAAFYHKSAEDLVDVAMAGAPSHRLGVAKVASSNIANNDCRGWCEEKLLVLFNDADTDVRLEAATCFRYLKDMPLQTYEALITAFCHSTAYQEGTFSLLYILEESLHRLPGITCLACETFLERFSDEAKNVSTRRAADVHYVPKLVFRMYHQHQNDEWASKCLDLIDKMCLEGIHDVHSGLDEFER